MREFCSMNNLLLNKRDPAVSLVCSPRDDIKIYISEIETPLGPMTAIAKNEALLYLNFSDCPKLNQQINNLKKGSPDFTGRIKRQHALKENIIISVLKKELNLYFKNELKEFTTPISFLGTDFQKSVWKELLKIPYGQRKSYSFIAERLKNPTAFRAVANANGANNFLILVPCHRVLNKNMELGGYSAGIDRKKYLLKLEEND